MHEWEYKSCENKLRSSRWLGVKLLGTWTLRVGVTRTATVHERDKVGMLVATISGVVYTRGSVQVSTARPVLDVVGCSKAPNAPCYNYAVRIGNFSCLGTLVICLANTILRFPAIDVLFYHRVPPGTVAVGLGHQL